MGNDSGEMAALDALHERITSFAEPIKAQAELLERSFERAFGNLERHMTRAARTGEFSFRAMAEAILADLARLAAQQFIAQPLTDFLGGLFNLSGKRQFGGPVAPGRAYLVGEQGPEVFVPTGHGAIEPRTPGRGVSIVFNVAAADAGSFLRSEAQIAAMLSRAAARGSRNL